jgi:hypothetical protein
MRLISRFNRNLSAVYGARDIWFDGVAVISPKRQEGEYVVI